MSETLIRYTCEVCKESIEIRKYSDWPQLNNYILYKQHHWFNWPIGFEEEEHCFCPDCLPEKFRIQEDTHPTFHDYRDYWENRPPEKRKSKTLDEPYNPIAALMQYDLCTCCEYRTLGHEDDGSTWSMCTVDNPKEHYGHNLYQGHFYGEPILGRFCPYFTHKPIIIGRDPKEDKKSGKFQVPYQEYYDGD